MTSIRRAALVTGASSGIGRAAAVALAEAGFDVTLNYSGNAAGAEKTAELAAALGAKTLIARCDVSDDVGVRAMLAAHTEAFGRLDALVNNAGTTANVAPKDFEAMTAEEWDRVFAVNVRGVFQVTRAALPLLRAVKGSVVNTASIVGLRPGPQPLPYAASKAAVVSLTKLLALNLGPEIRVNAVAPGWMEGEWMERMLGERYDDLMGRRAKATPLKRVVTAEVVVIDGGFASST
jgi:3-oxoacyl-[acyl-carrier protein] reductase